MPPRITLEELIEQIERIPAEWLDDVAEKVTDTISVVVEEIEHTSELRQSTIVTLLQRDEYTLDVFRLFLDLSQDTLANEINARGIGGRFSSIRSKAHEHAPVIAATLVDLGLLDTIEAHRIREWTLQDILLERYKQMRGRAIRGQQRGAALEESVQSVLDQLQAEYSLTYDSHGNFINRSGQEAKADFMVPSREQPSIVIEVKAYEATGSKLTDVLGDILKILQVKDPNTHFIFVTDGIGWFRRLSDLRKIVEYHHKGDIDMIYTRETVPQLRSYIPELLDL
jgi:hypothetical protein